MVNERLIHGQGMSSMISMFAGFVKTMLYLLIFLFVAAEELVNGFTAWVFRGSLPPANRTAALVVPVSSDV